MSVAGLGTALQACTHAYAGAGGKSKSHPGPSHKKRQFEGGPGRGVSNQRQSSYPPG